MDFQTIDEAALLSRMGDVWRQEESDPDAVADGVNPSPSWSLPGILGSTCVETSFGHVPAQLLRVGDMLKTRNGGYLKLIRLSDFKIDAAFLSCRPDAAPVVIPRGALGANLPMNDIELSPAHPVFVQPDRSEDPGVPAEAVSRRRGTIDLGLGMLHYLQLHLARRAQINCSGIWVSAEAA